MRHYTRFIPGEEIDEVEQWQFGSIDTATQLLAARVKALEVEEMAVRTESQMQQVYQDGYAAGLEQGKLQVQTEAQHQMQVFMDHQALGVAAKFTEIFASAQRAVEAAEQTMAQGVLSLSCELARQVLRHELSVNPQVVMPVLSEAIGLLGTEFKTAVVKLHPQDLVALGEQIQSDFAGMGLSLRADAEVLQGGCLLESAGCVIDGTLQKRWHKAIGTLGLSSVWELTDEPE